MTKTYLSWKDRHLCHLLARVKLQVWAEAVASERSHSHHEVCLRWVQEMKLNGEDAAYPKEIAAKINKEVDLGVVLYFSDSPAIRKRILGTCTDTTVLDVYRELGQLATLYKQRRVTKRKCPDPVVVECYEKLATVPRKKRRWGELK
jgi:hypothetical protein